jgi:hypothetical protein
LTLMPSATVNVKRMVGLPMPIWLYRTRSSNG